jgi:hypothetical protein
VCARRQNCRTSSIAARTYSWIVTHNWASSYPTASSSQIRQQSSFGPSL